MSTTELLASLVGRTIVEVEQIGPVFITLDDGRTIEFCAWWEGDGDGGLTIDGDMP